ncbi:hypothetical protein MIND_00878800 [Mycena indigotica]|uniref:Fungal-type protein kinase domain-containing protein n=1 Tax=Mycena indigotica TaxID=2126181 RepID=A0A8H6W2I4_9AGAR|nr:uncharacterized protein MIND_00878800 [Mycena indigotica]KAF7299298.1 hypothetical protein MIND_00878800 [Mycena indigotica]
MTQKAESHHQIQSFSALVDPNKFIDTYVGLARSQDETPGATVQLRSPNPPLSSESLMTFLEHAVSTFPDNSRPTFKWQAQSSRILGSRLGLRDMPTSCEWQHVGIVIKLADADFLPTAESNPDSSNTIRKLSKMARNIMVASENSYAFVVTALPDGSARIFRFDRATFIATHLFNLAEANSILLGFLQRFYLSNQRPIKHNTISASVATKTYSFLEWYRHLGRFAPEVGQLAMLTSPESLADTTLVIGSSRRLPGGPVKFHCLGLTPIFPENWSFDVRRFVQRPHPCYRVVFRHSTLEHEQQHDGEQSFEESGGMDLELDDGEDMELNGPGQTESSSAPELPNLQFKSLRCLLSAPCRPLWKFPRTKALVHGLYSVVAGHKRAYDAGVLHGDITPANLVYDDRTIDHPNGEAQGLLLDFDCINDNWYRRPEPTK